MADAPTKSLVSWDVPAIIRIVVTAIIAILGTLQIASKPSDTPTTTVNVTSEKPAEPALLSAPAAVATATAITPAPSPAPLPTPAPVPSPTKKIVVKPGVETWYTTDSLGKRIDSPELAALATSLTNGTYHVLGVPANGSVFVRRTVVIAAEGEPTPAPPKPPKPIPDPPTPQPDNKAYPLQVALIFESGNGMPEQFVLPDVEKYLNEHSIKGYDGRPAWRRLDPQLEFAKQAEADQWKPFLAGDHPSLPWVELRAGPNSFSGPCPADLLGLLKKYGGQ